MTTMKIPLLVVRRVFFDQFVSGEKTIEYRRHRPPFTIRTFYPGRQVRLAYTYNITHSISHLVKIASFEIVPARRLWERVPLLDVYPDLLPGDEIAMIGVAMQPHRDERSG
jgi:hypothetical protein